MFPRHDGQAPEDLLTGVVSSCEGSPSAGCRKTCWRGAKLTEILAMGGGVSNVDIDGNNTLQTKAIGVAISTFETLPTGLSPRTSPVTPHFSVSQQAIRAYLIEGTR